MCGREQKQNQKPEEAEAEAENTRFLRREPGTKTELSEAGSKPGKREKLLVPQCAQQPLKTRGFYGV